MYSNYRCENEQEFLDDVGIDYITVKRGDEEEVVILFDPDEDESFETYFDSVKADVAYCLGIEEDSEEWWDLMEI